MLLLITATTDILIASCIGFFGGYHNMNQYEWWICPVLAHFFGFGMIMASTWLMALLCIVGIRADGHSILSLALACQPQSLHVAMCFGRFRFDRFDITIFRYPKSKSKSTITTAEATLLDTEVYLGVVDDGRTSKTR
jgi:hypothetical protein